MTTKINSFALGDDAVKVNHLDTSIFGTSSGEVVQGNTTIQITTSGDISGGGTLTLGAGGTLNVSYSGPTNISHFTNDSNYVITETDPVFSAHAAANVTNTKIANWDTAYTWGDHSVEGYLTSETSHADVVVDGDFISQGIMLRGATAGAYAILTDNSANWNTAFGWGNHATQGYLTSATNNYTDSLAFNTSDGVLTVGRNGLGDLTVDLDGRYALVAGGQQDLDSVTTQGNTTTNTVTVGGMTVDGDLTVTGTTTTVLSESTRINENLLYLNESGESTITNAVGNGSTVTFTSDNTYSTGYTVDITGVNPSSFNFTNATITASDSSSFTVSSSVTDTYVSGGTAEGHAHVNVDLGWAGAYDDGTYQHAGFFRDASDGRFKAFDSYVPEPSDAVNINTSHASFSLADIQADTFYGALSGNASTASKWATARTITLGGDLSGSVSIDGSSDVLLTGTVADDSHNHIISNVDGLQTELDGKLDSTANAVSASVWQTSRTISLGGDLSGSVAIDGSTNVTLTATIGTNSIALGTDTTGNYVAEAGVAGNGLSGSVATETGTFTVTSNATSTNTVDTIVYRDSNGDFSAGTATLTATQAQYADLAEKYTVEYNHPTGTVMSVSYEVSLIDDGFETEPANSGDIPIGVVSDKPAFLMNETIDGQALALKGRVPVRVRGKVKKGEAVYVDVNGTASVHSVSFTGTNLHLVGVSLETNDTQAEKLVECVLKL